MRNFALTTLLFTIFTTAAVAVDWTGVSDCGIYEVRGVVRKTKHGPIIVINERSKSEIIISVSISNEAKLIPYVGRPMKATLTIENKPSEQPFLGIVNSIEFRLVKPLDPKDTFIKQISKAKCTK